VLAGYDHLLAAGTRLQWDEQAIDLRGDRVPASHEPAIRQLIAGFWIAEHAVAEHLAPFVAHAPAGTARACFELQAGDEARHARFFDRLAREVLGIDAGREARALAGPAIVRLFQEDLPVQAALLADDAGALPAAVGLYHLVLEGIVFAVGQEALLELLDDCGSMPGTREGVARVQADERWHIGLGVLSLQSLGRPADVADAAARAARAWGEDVVGDAFVERAMTAHARRLRFVTPGKASVP
jgi:ribonucleoside-diphosphate reductase beta chain